MFSPWLILIPVVVLSWAWLARRILDNPRDDALMGLAYHAGRLYCRVFHGLTIVGIENIPKGKQVGPLIVVANHTAGIDPLLIQAAVPFYVRWLMGKDMMLPAMDVIWEWLEIIAVRRGERDMGAAREGLRHLAQGGVLGVFPEGRLERPPFQIRPFHPGIGLLVNKTGAPVLPIVITGTPQVDPAWASLRVPSRSVLTIKPAIRYERGKTSPDVITRELRERFCAWTGWPENNG